MLSSQQPRHLTCPPRTHKGSDVATSSGTLVVVGLFGCLVVVGFFFFSSHLTHVRWDSSGALIRIS